MMVLPDPQPRSSVEKLEQALEQLTGAKAADAGQSMLLNTLKALLPSLRRLGYIPSDPDELDTILLAGARWMLGMRSDTAWQPEHINDLFFGPDPDPPRASAREAGTPPPREEP